MNILMVTNTFTPHIGGVARSVETFTAEYRRRGNRVLVIAPTFEGAPAEEMDVIRAPSIQNINGSDFCVPLPMPGMLATTLTEVPPSIVHSHHPFLLGDTALRVAAAYNAPIVFTHHTLYDQYVHYIGGESPTLQKIAVDIATGYCNLCDGVIAPSESVKQMLVDHGVLSPIRVIPTGVELERFAGGDRESFRRQSGISPETLVIGHVGRLAREKNLGFLATAVAEFLEHRPYALFMVVGAGPAEWEITEVFSQRGLSNRLRMTGALEGEALISAYRAMDIFAFASQSETQGMVLSEAMAAGVPVVAVDAPGVRDVLEDRVNGRLLPQENAAEFASALAWVADMDAAARKTMRSHLAKTAEHFSLEQCAARALDFYEELRANARTVRPIDDSPWLAALRWIEQEWRIMTHHAKAVGGALVEAVTPSVGPATAESVNADSELPAEAPRQENC